MKRIALLGVSAAMLAACAHMGVSSGPSAVANLESTQGNTAKGTVSFTQHGDKVRVTAQVSGLKPGAEHGFHVHEKGDCSSADGMSAGGHFNPATKPHGNYHVGGERHAGDLPNLKADASGNASTTFETTGISVGSGAADVVGKGLIVHRDPDDYKSQPAGNAGPRLACAVIRKS
ncbi:MAG TPA: superoxide dismutase family protein [Usitatibacter sp.]|nr:superoxide dismutase family protein [Usitatibacter sp.]